MFNPLDFLVLADQLRLQGGEAAMRASVGRSYYGCFLAIRDRLRLAVSGSTQVHQDVIRELYAMDNRRAALWLHQLRRLRNKTDYDTSVTVAANDAAQAAHLAALVIGRIERGL